MSTQTYKKTIKAELQRLNNEIDHKIIRGQSYIRESRRHKFLLRQLKGLNGSQVSWFEKALSTVSTFVL